MTWNDLCRQWFEDQRFVGSLCSFSFPWLFCESGNRCFLWVYADLVVDLSFGWHLLDCILRLTWILDPFHDSSCLDIAGHDRRQYLSCHLRLLRCHCEVSRQLRWTCDAFLYDDMSGKMEIEMSHHQWTLDWLCWLQAVHLDSVFEIDLNREQDNGQVVGVTLSVVLHINRKCIWYIPNNHGAHWLSPSLADLRMESGNGSECLTIAPYNPYSAMMVLLPQHFSVFRHFARRFWNHTYRHSE